MTFGVTLVVAALLGGWTWNATGRTVAGAMSGIDRDERARAAAARVRPALEAELATAGFALGKPMFVRIIKEERVLELWLERDGRYALFKPYPICTWSGELGPKLRQGDRQSPEGFYRVALGQLNPASRYHLSFNLGYPNAYDRAHGRTGDYLMVHGSCVSIGCYAIGDDAIEEVYTLLEASLRAGQRHVDVHVFPFRLGPDARERIDASPWREFWHNLGEGYAAFEREGVPPAVAVSDGRYVFPR